MVALRSVETSGQVLLKILAYFITTLLGCVACCSLLGRI